MKFIDMTGQRFGRLIVVQRAPNRGSKIYWLCRCDCGGSNEVAAHALKRSNCPIRSCGCLEQARRIDHSSAEQACRRPSKKHPNGRTGTTAGWGAHYYIGQDPCEACEEGLRRDNAEKFAADPMRASRMALWSKYRLTLERYEQLLKEQGGCCAICLAESPRDIRASRFHVDHDHACCPGNMTCGQCVRGLLCAGCNTALGNFGDDRERLLRAVQYLSKWPGTRPVTGLRPRIPRKAARHGAEGTVAS